jgi:hypothetical protein
MPDSRVSQVRFEALACLPTDLPAHVLQSFEKNLHTPLGARLRGVELSDSVLTDIGYFID